MQRLFVNDDGRADLAILEKVLRHHPGEAHTTVRRRIVRDMSRMEPIPTGKPHIKGHLGTLECAAFRHFHLAHVHVALDHLAIRIDEAAVEIRDVIFVLLCHHIVADLRGKTLLACAATRFSDAHIAAEKVGSLVGYIHHDLRRPFRSSVVPGVRWRGWFGGRRLGGWGWRWLGGTTGQNTHRDEGKSQAGEVSFFHKGQKP